MLDLAATQRLTYKVMTKHKHSDKAVRNLLNQNFNLVYKDDDSVGHVGYLQMDESLIFWRLWCFCILGAL